MTQLYKLTGEWAALQSLAEDGEDISSALAALGDKLEVKAERVAAVLRNFDAEIDALAAEEKRLSARRKSRENAKEHLREYLRRSMEDGGIRRLKCAAFTAYLTEREAVIVDDESAVPPEYVTEKVTRSVNRRDILTAHQQNGECVPGARVVVTNTLTIK